MLTTTISEREELAGGHWRAISEARGGPCGIRTQSRRAIHIAILITAVIAMQISLIGGHLEYAWKLFSLDWAACFSPRGAAIQMRLRSFVTPWRETASRDAGVEAEAA